MSAGVGLFRELPLPTVNRRGTPHDVAAEAQRARDLISHLNALKISAEERYVLIGVNWALQAIALRATEPQARVDHAILETLAVHAERRARELQGQQTESVGLRRDLPAIIGHIETLRAMIAGWREGA